MTNWYAAKCEKCGSCSPPLFVLFNGHLSLYPIDESGRGLGGEWVEEHQSHGGIRLLTEDEDEREG